MSNPNPSLLSNRGRGRPKGSLNLATRDLVQFWDRFFKSVEYRESAKARILGGKAPHLESYLLQRVYGKPPDYIRLSQEREDSLAELSDEQLAERAELIATVLREKQRAEALAAEAGVGLLAEKPVSDLVQ